MDGYSNIVHTARARLVQALTVATVISLSLPNILFGRHFHCLKKLKEVSWTASTVT